MAATMTFDIDTADFDELRDRMTRLYEEVLMADAELYEMLEPVQLRGDLVPVAEAPLFNLVSAAPEEIIHLETVHVERAA